MKRFISLLFIASVAMGSTFAYDFKSGDLYYNITSNAAPYTVAVTYQWTEVDVNYSKLTTANIPETVTFDGKTYAVTSIGEMAFYYCNSLTSVTIPNSVTSIGEFAFVGCIGLTSVTIPNSVTSIGELAFGGCIGITSIIIPKNVTSIGGLAFGDCTGLTSITCQAITPPTCNNFAFDGLPQSIPVYIPCGTTTAYRNATGWKTFSNLQEPPIVYSVLVQSANAEMGNTNCTLTQTVDCEATAIFSATPKFGYQFVRWSDGSTEVSRTIVLTQDTILTAEFAHTVYGQCGDNLYWQYNAGELTLTGTGEMYSYYSTNIPWLRLQDSITTVSLASAETTIGDYAFSGCTKLSSVTIPNNVTGIGKYAFYGCSGLTTVTVGDGVTSIGEYTFYGCSSLTSVTLSNSVTSIGRSAFHNCTILSSVTIPNNVTGIGKYAFYGCSGLTTVTVGDGVTSIGEYTFYGCSSLTSVTLSNSVTSIGRSAFHNCTILSSVTIPNSVMRIEDSAFEGCSGLSSVTLGNSVASIGANAFAGCKKLYDIYCYPTTPPTAYTSSFANYNVYIHVPCEVLRDYQMDVLFGSFKYIQCLSNPVSFTITTTCNPIQGTATGGGTYDEGTEITLTATPNNGYRFAQWSDGNTDNPRSVSVTEDKTYTAEFIKLCVITVDCDAAQGIAMGGGTYDEGTTITLTATPNNGYRFAQWSDGNTDNPRTVTATEDKTYTAEFVKLCVITVDCDAAQGTVTGSGTYDEGTAVTLTATPNDGYRFVQWSDGNTDNPRTVSVTEDKTYTAEFVKLCVITVDCDAAQGIVTGGGTYDEGTTITLTATPSNGYRFEQWSDGNTDNPRTVTATEDKTYTAEFVKLCIITVDCDAAQGIVTGSGTYDEGTIITLTATPNDGYRFSQWSDGNTDNPRTVTATEDKNYTAEFVKLCIITADCDAAQGTVTGGGTYDEGTTVTLTATPNKGYVFARWDDNNTDNPRSVVVLADAAYTAFFDEEQTALDQVGADGTAAQKIIRNGQVLIQRGDKLYILTGQEIIKQ